MKYSLARQGRTFVIRLEDGDVVHEQVEAFARKESVSSAALIILGAADEGSELVVGPRHGRAESLTVMGRALDNVHEVAGVGTLFPDEQGAPTLHMHMACGREASTTTGCIRKGVKVWHTMEIILFELVDSTGIRVHDPKLGFQLLNP